MSALEWLWSGLTLFLVLVLLYLFVIAPWVDHAEEQERIRHAERALEAWEQAERIYKARTAANPHTTGEQP